MDFCLRLKLWQCRRRKFYKANSSIGENFQALLPEGARQ
jgi:hypothetical protein